MRPKLRSPRKSLSNRYPDFDFATGEVIEEAHFEEYSDVIPNQEVANSNCSGAENPNSAAGRKSSGFVEEAGQSSELSCSSHQTENETLSAEKNVDSNVLQSVSAKTGEKDNAVPTLDTDQKLDGRLQKGNKRGRPRNRRNFKDASSEVVANVLPKQVSFDTSPEIVKLLAAPSMLHQMSSKMEDQGKSVQDFVDANKQTQLQQLPYSGICTVPNFASYQTTGLQPFAIQYQQCQTLTINGGQLYTGEGGVHKAPPSWLPGVPQFVPNVNLLSHGVPAGTTFLVPPVQQVSHSQVNSHQGYQAAQPYAVTQPVTMMNALRPIQVQRRDGSLVTAFVAANETIPDGQFEEISEDGASGNTGTSSTQKSSVDVEQSDMKVSSAEESSQVPTSSACTGETLTSSSSTENTKTSEEGSSLKISRVFSLAPLSNINEISSPKTAIESERHVVSRTHGISKEIADLNGTLTKRDETIYSGNSEANLVTFHSVDGMNNVGRREADSDNAKGRYSFQSKRDLPQINFRTSPNVSMKYQHMQSLSEEGRYHNIQLLESEQQSEPELQVLDLSLPKDGSSRNTPNTTHSPPKLVDLSVAGDIREKSVTNWENVHRGSSVKTQVNQALPTENTPLWGNDILSASTKQPEIHQVAKKGEDGYASQPENSCDHRNPENGNVADSETNVDAKIKELLAFSIRNRDRKRQPRKMKRGQESSTVPQANIQQAAFLKQLNLSTSHSSSYSTNVTTSLTTPLQGVTLCPSVHQDETRKFGETVGKTAEAFIGQRQSQTPNQATITHVSNIDKIIDKVAKGILPDHSTKGRRKPQKQRRNIRHAFDGKKSSGPQKAQGKTANAAVLYVRRRSREAKGASNKSDRLQTGFSEFEWYIVPKHDGTPCDKGEAGHESETETIPYSDPDYQREESSAESNGFAKRDRENDQPDMVVDNDKVCEDDSKFNPKLVLRISLKTGECLRTHNEPVSDKLDNGDQENLNELENAGDPFIENEKAPDKEPDLGESERDDNIHANSYPERDTESTEKHDDQPNLGKSEISTLESDCLSHILPENNSSILVSQEVERVNQRNDVNSRNRSGQCEEQTNPQISDTRPMKNDVTDNAISKETQVEHAKTFSNPVEVSADILSQNMVKESCMNLIGHLSESTSKIQRNDPQVTNGDSQENSQAKTLNTKQTQLEDENCKTLCGENNKNSLELQMNKASGSPELQVEESSGKKNIMTVRPFIIIKPAQNEKQIEDDVVSNESVPYKVEDNKNKSPCPFTSFCGETSEKTPTLSNVVKETEDTCVSSISNQRELCDNNDEISKEELNTNLNLHKTLVIDIKRLSGYISREKSHTIKVKTSQEEIPRHFSRCLQFDKDSGILGITDDERNMFDCFRIKLVENKCMLREKMTPTPVGDELPEAKQSNDTTNNDTSDIAPTTRTVERPRKAASEIQSSTSKVTCRTHSKKILSVKAKQGARKGIKARSASSTRNKIIGEKERQKNIRKRMAKARAVKIQKHITKKRKIGKSFGKAWMYRLMEPENIHRKLRKDATRISEAVPLPLLYPGITPMHSVSREASVARTEASKDTPYTPKTREVNQAKETLQKRKIPKTSKRMVNIIRKFKQQYSYLSMADRVKLRRGSSNIHLSKSKQRRYSMSKSGFKRAPNIICKVQENSASTSSNGKSERSSDIKLKEVKIDTVELKKELKIPLSRHEARYSIANPYAAEKHGNRRDESPAVKMKMSCLNQDSEMSTADSNTLVYIKHEPEDDGYQCLLNSEMTAMVSSGENTRKPIKESVENITVPRSSIKRQHIMTKLKNTSKEVPPNPENDTDSLVTQKTKVKKYVHKKGRKCHSVPKTGKLGPVKKRKMNAICERPEKKKNLAVATESLQRPQPKQQRGSDIVKTIPMEDFSQSTVSLGHDISADQPRGHTDEKTTGESVSGNYTVKPVSTVSDGNFQNINAGQIEKKLVVVLGKSSGNDASYMQNAEYKNQGKQDITNQKKQEVKGKMGASNSERAGCQESHLEQDNFKIPPTDVEHKKQKKKHSRRNEFGMLLLDKQRITHRKRTTSSSSTRNASQSPNRPVSTRLKKHKSSSVSKQNTKAKHIQFMRKQQGQGFSYKKRDHMGIHKICPKLKGAVSIRRQANKPKKKWKFQRIEENISFKIQTGAKKFPISKIKSETDETEKDSEICDNNSNLQQNTLSIIPEPALETVLYIKAELIDDAYIQAAQGETAKSNERDPAYSEIEKGDKDTAVICQTKLKRKYPTDKNMTTGAKICLASAKVKRILPEVKDKGSPSFTKPVDRPELKKNRHGHPSIKVKPKKIEELCQNTNKVLKKPLEMRKQKDLKPAKDHKQDETLFTADQSPACVHVNKDKLAITIDSKVDYTVTKNQGSHTTGGLSHGNDLKILIKPCDIKFSP